MRARLALLWYLRVLSLTGVLLVASPVAAFFAWAAVNQWRKPAKLRWTRTTTEQADSALGEGVETPNNRQERGRL